MTHNEREQHPGSSSGFTFRVPRLAFRVARPALYVLLIVLAARLIFQPDLRDDLRQADQLFRTAHYHAALQRYVDLTAKHESAEIKLRLGMIRVVRGEYDLAERALRHATTLGLREADHNVAALYLGQVLIERGQPLGALRTWAQIGSCDRQAALCRYDGPRRVLRAEWSLRQGDYAAAETDFRAALALGLPADWHALATYRLSLLESARTPEATLARLTQAEAPATAPADSLLTPLLPAPRGTPDELRTALAADPALRPQLLGRIYLDQDLYGLAEAQFSQVAPDSPNALAAAAYAAYTRWRAGDRQEGLKRLEQLVQEHPDEPRARTLLALAYLSTEDAAAARTRLDTILALAPSDPDVHLVWANWYVAQRDYVNASAEYQRALVQARPEQRGAYALLVARFHLTNTYELCELGLPAAELAARNLPDNEEAWTTLAAHRYHCNNFAGAVEAARMALTQTPGAAAAFYLGSALTALGDNEAARQTFIQAADLAPASVWRERAEAALASLP